MKPGKWSAWGGPRRGHLGAMSDLVNLHSLLFECIASSVTAKHQMCLLMVHLMVVWRFARFLTHHRSSKINRTL